MLRYGPKEHADLLLCKGDGHAAASLKNDVVYASQREDGYLARGPVARVMADKERVPAMITLVSVGDS
jgi:hypothetical protein